jgi:hypothetical protein
MIQIIAILSFFLLFIPGFKVFGQRINKNKFKYTTVGFNLNAMNYVGDLDPSPGILGPGLKFTHMNLGISLQQKIRPRISIRGNVSFGRIQASDVGNASYSQKDIYRKVRNLSFRNNIWEFKGDVVWDLFSFWGKSMKRPDYVPYVFTGIAFFHHNPQALTPEAYGSRWVNLKPMKLEGKSYSLNQIAIPLGFGFRYKINKSFDLAFEMGARFTFTDYLDDVSGSYQGKGKFENDPLRMAMQDRSIEGIQKDPYLSDWVESGNGYTNSNGYITVNGYGNEGDQRGNSNRKDWYLITGFHLTYIILRSDVRCPPKF